MIFFIDVAPWAARGCPMSPPPLVISCCQWGDGISLAINPRAMENCLLELPCLANKVRPVVVDVRLVFQLTLPGTPAKTIKGSG